MQQLYYIKFYETFRPSHFTQSTGPTERWCKVDLKREVMGHITDPSAATIGDKEHITRCLNFLIDQLKHKKIVVPIITYQSSLDPLLYYSTKYEVHECDDTSITILLASGVAFTYEMVEVPMKHLLGAVL